jgi:hypothetical protein
LVGNDADGGELLVGPVLELSQAPENLFFGKAARDAVGNAFVNL